MQKTAAHSNQLQLKKKIATKYREMIPLHPQPTTYSREITPNPTPK